MLYPMLSILKLLTTLKKKSKYIDKKHEFLEEKFGNEK